jgi:hypothetical protein
MFGYSIIIKEVYCHLKRSPHCTLCSVLIYGIAVWPGADTIGFKLRNRTTSSGIARSLSLREREKNSHF